MHHLVEQNREIEHSKPGHERARQPEIPAVQVDDPPRCGREGSHVCQRHRRMKPGAALMQDSQSLHRELVRQVTLELAGMVSIVVGHRNLGT